MPRNAIIGANFRPPRLIPRSGMSFERRSTGSTSLGPPLPSPGVVPTPAGRTIYKRFKILRVLGVGGMGIVYMVADSVNSNMVVAVKVCRVFLDNPEATDVCRQRFVREAGLMRKVQHRHVLPILSVSLDADPPYFVMPCAIGSLHSELSAGVQWTYRQKLGLLLQISLGMSAVHQKEMLHRDLKPENILRLANDEVAVTDFGLGRDAESDRLTQGGFVGTPGYEAPEQRRGVHSKASDVFQMGMLFLELTTGGLDESKLSGLNNELESIIRKALEDKPTDRYSDASEVVGALSALLLRVPTFDSLEYIDGQLRDMRRHAAAGAFWPTDYEHLATLLLSQVVPGKHLCGFVDRMPNLYFLHGARSMPSLTAAVMDAYLSHLPYWQVNKTAGFADALLDRSIELLSQDIPSEIAIQLVAIALSVVANSGCPLVSNRCVRELAELDLKDRHQTCASAVRLVVPYMASSLISITDAMLEAGLLRRWARDKARKLTQ